MSLGLRWLKAFPAHWLGTDWFKHIAARSSRRASSPSAQP